MNSIVKNGPSSVLGQVVITREAGMSERLEHAELALQPQKGGAGCGSKESLSALPAPAETGRVPAIRSPTSRAPTRGCSGSERYRRQGLAPLATFASTRVFLYSRGSRPSKRTNRMGRLADRRLALAPAARLDERLGPGAWPLKKAHFTNANASLFWR